VETEGLTVGDQERKTKKERLQRLRERLQGPRADLQAVLKGVIDLLEDEL
jgi:hypothetical protein